MIAALLALTLTTGQTAPPGSWTVNDNNTLVWAGQPYIPIGLRVDASAGAVAAAKEAGVHDLLIEVPGDPETWAAAVAPAQEAGLRFFVSPTALAPTAEVYAIEPESYRVGSVVGDFEATFTIPGGRDALVVLASQRDGTARWHQRIPIVDDRLRVALKPGPASPHVLLIYPSVQDGRAPDLWEGFDLRRDALLAGLKERPLGAGLRGIVNPLGTVPRFPGVDSAYVPRSRLFRVELATFLEQKYGSLETALRAWALGSNSVADFSHLARLVPLWSETRGVGNLWDPETDGLTAADSASSAAWRDIREVMRSIARRRYDRLVAAVRSVAAVPVVQDWSGWGGPYEGMGAVVDGVAFRADTATMEGLIEAGSRPASTLLRWGRPGLLMASDLTLTTTGDRPVDPESAVRELEGMGVRAVFVRAETPEARATVARLAAARRDDPSASQWRPQALFYPEAARDPAVPGRLEGGVWWLPAPAQGGRIDYGPLYAGYRYTAGSQNFVALWSRGGPRRVKLRVSDPRTVQVTDVFGTAIEVRRNRTDIEMEIPTRPILFTGSDDPPVPFDAFQDASAVIDRLFSSFEGRLSDATEQQVYFMDSMRSWERVPGPSFLALRKQANELLPRAAPYLWVSAARSPESNFSGPIPSTGTAFPLVLSLESRLDAPLGGFRARYPLTPRGAGKHEVWMAARIPLRARPTVRVRVGTVVLRIEGHPVSFYGEGFAWYRFGEVDLPAGQSDVFIECDVPDAAMQIDVLMLSPTPFAPNGPFPPDDFVRSAPAPADERRGPPGR